MSPTVKIIAIFSDFLRICESKVAFSIKLSPYSLKKESILSDFCYFKIKPEMRDVLAKMREISQNAGFAARLRDD